jgi:general secretion pathway protein C
MGRAVKIINLLIILSIIIFIPLTVRSFLTPSKETVLDISTQGRSDQKEVDKGYSLKHYDIILKKNPFGIRELNYSRSSEEAYTVGDLVLVGTVHDGRGHGYAVLMDSTGRQNIYHTGQEVPSVGRLVRVDSESALIVGTTSKRLKLIDIEEAIKKRKDIVKRSPRLLRSPRRIDSFIKRTASGEYVVDRFKVEEAIEHPQQLMTDARLQPVFRDGKQYGFVLKEVKRDGIYYKLGLRNNDILLRINEFDITDPETALRAFTQLRGADEIELYILRNGKEKRLRYIIR